ncbi:MAG: tetraacyldisaccharide 4'-kinase [Pyrinomonadaceae bacterium]|nr:tetraacyldisaccharide 4'-kinase [Pyrinomonadaceae bacterium]
MLYQPASFAALPKIIMRQFSAFFLSPLGALYGVSVQARAALYRNKILRAQKIPAPVISVGNLTVGGTGKTPLVEWIARRAAEENRRVCILTRGYGRADISKRIIVSDGEQLLADARTGGDEPRLLAEMLQGTAAVISDRDRAGAARWAIEHLGCDAFILDDGFQHLRMMRDLDIVTIDASDAWGGGKLLPAGRLRERRTALERADCIVITRADQAPDVEALRNEVEELSKGCPVIVSRVSTCGLRPLTPALRDEGFEQDPASHPVVLFCALGNPQSFLAHARKDNFKMALVKFFPDHRFYTQRDVDELIRAALLQHGALRLLTTAKDAVKLATLHFSLPCYVLETKLEFDDEEKLISMVRKPLAV